MSTTITTTIISLIEQHRARSEAARRAHNTRYLKIASDVNDGVEPTIDCNGRFHAPYDGYDFDGHVYLAGQYLPFPKYDEDEYYRQTYSFGNYVPKTRFTYVDADLASTLVRELNEHLEIFHGKVFEGKTGQQCHLYVTTRYKDVIEVLDSEINKKVVEAVDTRNIPDLPEGKLTFVGKVLSIKNQESFYGIVTKILVEHEEGYKVWGTLPRSINHVDRGETVSFSATITRSDKDPSFGFFSRPTKAKIVE
jgi:hypothetical protein